MILTSLRVLILATVATVGVVTPVTVDTVAEAKPSAAADPAVITEWNAIAERTIFTENATPVPSSTLYFGFVSIAVYDAVVAIEGGYEPYHALRKAHRHASSEAAAATAAYGVLRYYFPNSARALRTDYLATLADLPKNKALARGILTGASAATALIRSRFGDGRNAQITLDVAPAPGVWRSTPDAFAPMLVPWLGFVRPLVLDSPTQFELPAPNALDSEAYATDFAEVKAYGARTGSLRSDEQTATATFFGANAAIQYYTGMRDAVTRRGLGIVESARAFALMGSATGDALISCWRAKYDTPTWRPITAIQLADTDGNDATEADPDWLPLIQTPPYPEYASGHACFTGAASNTFAYLFGANSIDLNLPLPGTSTIRHYDSADSLDEDAMNGRIWLGIHFRASMTLANELGHAVSDWAIGKYFQPTKR